MKNLILIVLFFLCLSVSSCFFLDCECCGCEGGIFEAQVAVVDMDNKPIKDIAVGSKWQYSLTISRVSTNEQGQAAFKINWGPDVSTSLTLAATDGAGYKAVNYLEGPYRYTPEHKVITFIDTIKMDVLRPISIRLSTKRTDVKNVALFVERNDYPYLTSQYKKVERRSFITLNNATNTPQLDTTIQVNVYSKASFNIYGRLSFKNAPVDSSYGIFVPDYANRDSVFLLAF